MCSPNTGLSIPHLMQSGLKLEGGRGHWRLKSRVVLNLRNLGVDQRTAIFPQWVPIAAAQAWQKA
jgi:hypothetical protein